MTLLIVLAAAAPFYASTIGRGECAAPASAPALDHVVLAVHDLERASAPFRRHGFRLKNGRLHPNNLLNRHIKFRDGSSIELMTVRGQPGDAMAARYAALLAAGEGGVYAALNIADIERAARTASRLKLEHHSSSSGPWQFIGFPATSSAAAIFFSGGGGGVQDADSLLAHVPVVDGLTEVWLEGGPELMILLERLGATRCGRARAHAGITGERLRLSRGYLVVVPQRSGIRPRVLGAVIRSEKRSATLIRPHPHFWLVYYPRPN